MLKHYPSHKIILATLDLISLWGAFLMADVYDPIKIGIFLDVRFLFLLISIYSILSLFTFQYHQLYKQHIFLTKAAQFTLLFKSMLIIGAGLIIILYFFNHSIVLFINRFNFLLWIFLSFCTLVVLRIIIFRPLYKSFSKTNALKQNVLIVGAGKSGRQIASSFMRDSGNNKKIVGFVDDFIKSETVVVPSIKVLGSTPDIKKIVCRKHIDLIIICISTISKKKLIDLYEHCLETGATVKIYSDVVSFIANKVPLEMFSGFHLVGSNRMLDSIFFRAFKRLVDIVISIFMIFLFFPFFILIGLAIKMNSRGPVFFKQTRIGKMGKPFTFYKFRSMIVNNDDSLHRSYTQNFIKNGHPASASDQKATFKIKDDPRVTKVGKLLRATSIDELPQLFNVLKGEMSLVGPRPCMPYEWEHYEDWHKKRLSVTPGCTGLWQVSGRSAVGFDDMVLLDLFYINNMSPWFDLQLIIKTIPVMVLAKGAH